MNIRNAENNPIDDTEAHRPHSRPRIVAIATDNSAYAHPGRIDPYRLPRKLAKSSHDIPPATQIFRGTSVPCAIVPANAPYGG
jgi:hypothetical protein